MADQDNYKTYVRETRTTEPSGGNMALIVGGLVVAVAFILWLVFAGPGPVSTTPDIVEPSTAPATEPAVEPVTPDAAAPDAVAPDAVAPDAAVPDATAPDAAAPADDGAVAPADGGTAPTAPVEE